jgi:putative ABC transport system substrate-binding protein
MTTRRDLLIGFGATLLAGPLSALAQQQSKPWRIGFFYFGSRQSTIETGRYAAFLQGMREVGYIEEKHFVVEARYADGDAERFPAVAAELVRSKVDVIVSTAIPMHRVMQKATSTIPIVITVSFDPVKEGLARSLAHPGGNITGLTSSNAELSRKYLEVLSDTMPSLSRIHVLFTKSNPTHTDQLSNVSAAAGAAGIQVKAFDVATSQDIDAAFADIARFRPNAVIILADGLFIEHARRLAELALKHKLPMMYGTSEFPEAGGLMSYGPDIRNNYRRAATYVDRILKGAKPADLPIEQPSKFELVFNLKTAKALRLQIPKAMLFRADRVIE